MKLILTIAAVMLIVQPVQAADQDELDCALHMSGLKGIVHERYNNTMSKKHEEDRDPQIIKLFDMLDREQSLINALTARFGACFADRYFTEKFGGERIKIF